MYLFIGISYVLFIGILCVLFIGISYVLFIGISYVLFIAAARERGYVLFIGISYALFSGILCVLYWNIVCIVYWDIIRIVYCRCERTWIDHHSKKKTRKEAQRQAVASYERNSCERNSTHNQDIFHELVLPL